MQRGDVIKGPGFLATLHSTAPLRAYGERREKDRMRALVYEWLPERELLAVSHRRDQTLHQILCEADLARPYLRLCAVRHGESQPADAQAVAARIAQLLAESERGDDGTEQ